MNELVHMEKATLNATEAQMTVLRAFAELSARLGRPPTTREIAAHVGRKPLSVYVHRRKLLDAGLLVYDPPQGVLPFAASDHHKLVGHVRSRYIRVSGDALAVLSRAGRACPTCGRAFDFDMDAGCDGVQNGCSVPDDRKST